MTRPPHNPGAWPGWMRAATAAAYVDEKSVEAFLRKVGSVYPAASVGQGRNAKWEKSALDVAMTARKGQPVTTQMPPGFDAANVL